MKKLHEKKISEIVQDSQDRYEEIDYSSYNKCMRFVGENLKAWAIAIVKNCERRLIRNRRKFDSIKYKPGTHEWKKFCYKQNGLMNARNFLIDRVPLTEEDLK